MQLIEILSSLKDSDALEHVPTNRIHKFPESVNLPSDGTHENLITRLLNKTLSDGNVIEVLSSVIPLNEVPYSFDDNGLTVHIPASYLEDVDVKALVFVNFNQDLFSIPMEKHQKIRGLLYHSGMEGVMQAFELMDAMEVSYGEMLSIFQLPPIFSSWEMLLKLVQKSYHDASDSSGVHYMARILSYLASKGEEWALETTELHLGGVCSCHIA